MASIECKYDKPAANQEEFVPITKTFRSIEEIDAYLTNFVPPNISATTIIQSVVFCLFPFAINTMFITNNLVGILHDHDDKVVSYLDVIHCIIVYVEFSGLIILFLFLTCCCLLGKINLIIDTINYIKSWSTFTLFYAFRPTAIFNFYKTIYNHQISTEQQNEKNKCNKYKLLLQQINHE
eukprot:539913_1